ncbi:hypothetical protein GQX73_g5858 [Xylaria multiplex]|uniref:Xylanolytic transcriptional activator regulatory domain-containing protein n=1 Tax=Xylaria multiplex TaxID=323545 RepID=A0A7C8IMS3_9PEZI|nr:hypothetical protein GQX73_g5858 [Xylaria multiplex]
MEFDSLLAESLNSRRNIFPLALLEIVSIGVTLHDKLRFMVIIDGVLVFVKNPETSVHKEGRCPIIDAALFWVVSHHHGETSGRLAQAPGLRNHATRSLGSQDLADLFAEYQIDAQNMRESRGVDTALCLGDAVGRVCRKGWVSLVFAGFRAHTQEILDTDGVTTSEKGFLLLLLAVLVTGARFIDPDAIHIYHPSFDATAFQVRTIAAIENHLILALNDFSLESIAFLLLMSSTYLQMRKVQLAFMVSGMGVRMAQAMGLSEAVWPTVDDLERQVRRRLWWSMYMTDMYTAQAYGKPAILDESHFHVSQPQDLDDTITTCPGFNSLELREENKMHPVTMLSYNRYKSQLYVIAARMTGNMSIQQIQTVMKDLVDWGKALPPELRPGSFVGKEREVMSNPALRVFALQALTLQVTFDNMYLVLFRPFLCSGRSASMVFPDSTSQPLTAPILPGSSIRQQLLESAMRTSNIGRSLEILRLVSRTTAANQVGFHCFTAGVTLGMLALLDLASPRLLELKQALARMINILGIVGAQTPLCGQSIEILTDMIHLIASQEVKHMISRTVSSSTHPGPCNARTEPGAIESGTDIGAGVSESLGQGCDCIQTSAECGDTGETDPWPDLEMLFGEQAFAQLNQIWSYDPIPRGVYE